MKYASALRGAIFATATLLIAGLASAQPREEVKIGLASTSVLGMLEPAVAQSRGQNVVASAKAVPCLEVLRSEAAAHASTVNNNGFSGRQS